MKKVVHSSARFERLLASTASETEALHLLSSECQPLVLERGDKRYRVLRSRITAFPRFAGQWMREKHSERLCRLQAKAGAPAGCVVLGSVDTQRLCAKWTEWVAGKNFVIAGGIHNQVPETEHE